MQTSHCIHPLVIVLLILASFLILRSKQDSSSSPRGDLLATSSNGVYELRKDSDESIAVVKRETKKVVGKLSNVTPLQETFFSADNSRIVTLHTEECPPESESCDPTTYLEQYSPEGQALGRQAVSIDDDPAVSRGAGLALNFVRWMSDTTALVQSTDNNSYLQMALQLEPVLRLQKLSLEGDVIATNAIGWELPPQSELILVGESEPLYGDKACETPYWNALTGVSIFDSNGKRLGGVRDSQRRLRVISIDATARVITIERSNSFSSAVCDEVPTVQARYNFEGVLL